MLREALPIAWPSRDGSSVPFEVFTRADVFAREQEAIFRGPVWNYVALEAELPEPCDFKTSFVGDTPIIVSRAEDGSLHAFVNRCVAYEDKGKPDLAVQDCSAAIALNPTDAVAYNDRGVAYEKTGNIDGALADYSKAIELDPSYRDAFANRAVLYDHKGDKERAIADYRAALAKNPAPEDRKDIETALERLGATP